MDYLPWIVVALLSYSLIGPIVKIIESEVPTETDVFITTAVMLLVTLGSVFVFGPANLDNLSATSVRFALLGGIFLAVGVIAFFRALKDGPVSVVVPIYGLFIVMSSLLGIVFFDESYSVVKVTGIVLAMAAIYLTASGSS